MNKVLYVAPEKDNKTRVAWVDGSEVYGFDSHIEFSDAVVFFKKRQVVVFHSQPSNEVDFVGRVFDLMGCSLFDIPFPDLGWQYSHICLAYRWSSEIENGIKITFGTNSVSYRDFWCDFNLDGRVYVASNEAR